MPKLVIRRQQKQAAYFTEKLDNNVGLDMVFIPGGSFLMGTEDKEIDRLYKIYNREFFKAEKPQHQVTVPDFMMGRYPITQAQWREVANLPKIQTELNPDPSYFKDNYEKIDRWTRPVESISWNDAKEFCDRLRDKTGRQYRLPTEAEWEYACRGGTQTPFHFGETISTDLANYDGNYIYGEGVVGIYREQTTPVGYFKIANNFGLSDLHGNVWEWCEDYWHENYENAPTDGSAWLSSSGHTKVVRGGSWFNYPDSCRSAFRSFNARGFRSLDIGFRVVCVAPRTT